MDFEGYRFVYEISDIQFSKISVEENRTAADSCYYHQPSTIAT